MSTPSLNSSRSKGPTISPTLRTSAVTFPRQLAPTVGPALAGVEILRGDLQGMEGFVTGRITRSRSGMLCIDDTTWGPEAHFMESGYQVPVGSIHLFIGRLNTSEPEPNHYESTEASSRRLAGSDRAFIGFINEPPKLTYSANTSMDGKPAIILGQDKAHTEAQKQPPIRLYGLKNAAATYQRIRES